MICSQTLQLKLQGMWEVNSIECGVEESCGCDGQSRRHVTMAGPDRKNSCPARPADQVEGPKLCHSMREVHVQGRIVV